ncbi:MAG: TolC family protein [Spirochaetales bacterium]|nr:TolC family protein [Spirochaetales bacterium]
MKFVLIWGLLLTGQIALAQSLTLSLKQAEDRAVAVSTNLAMERSQAALGKLRYDLGWRAFLPTLSFGYSENDSIVTDSPDSFDKQLYTTIKQTVFDGGKSFRDHRLSALQLEQTFHELEVDRRLQRQKVWELYKNLELAQKRFEVLMQGYRQAVEEEKLSEARQAVGEITQLDVLDVQVQVSQLSDQVDEARLAVTDHATRLRELLKLRPGTPLLLADPLDGTYSGFPIVDSPAIFLRQAETASLEYAKFRLNIREVATQREAMTWSWLPSVEVETTLSASASNFPLRQPGVNVSVSLRFPVPYSPVSFSLGGGFQGDVSRSRTVASSTEVLSDLSSLTAGTELSLKVINLQDKITTWKQSILDQSEDFIEGYKIRQHKLETLRQILQLEHQRESLLKERLKVGEIKPAELLIEQGKVLNASNDVWNAVVDLMLQERRFETILGLPEGGLKRLEARP